MGVDKNYLQTSNKSTFVLFFQPGALQIIQESVLECMKKSQKYEMFGFIRTDTEILCKYELIVSSAETFERLKKRFNHNLY